MPVMDTSMGFLTMEGSILVDVEDDEDLVDLEEFGLNILIGLSGLWRRPFLDPLVEDMTG